MKNHVFSIGKNAALLSLISILVWFVSFGMIAADGPLFFWSTPDAYYKYFAENSQLWQNLAKAFMLVFSLGFLVLHISLYEIQAENRKFPGKIGLIFLSMFALLSGLHYFAQLSSVRLSIEQGSTIGLEHFLQANPASFSLAVNMLGWTLLLGLASLFMGMLFPGSGRQRWLKYFHFINAIFCLFALIGYMFHLDALTFPAINIGVGGCITVITVLGWLTLRKQHG